MMAGGTMDGVDSQEVTGLTDWSKCAAVESVPGRLSGAWVSIPSRRR